MLITAISSVTLIIIDTLYMYRSCVCWFQQFIYQFVVCHDQSLLDNIVLVLKLLTYFIINAYGWFLILVVNYFVSWPPVYIRSLLDNADHMVCPSAQA